MISLKSFNLLSRAFWSQKWQLGCFPFSVPTRINMFDRSRTTRHLLLLLIPSNPLALLHPTIILVICCLNLTVIKFLRKIPLEVPTVGTW